MALEKEITHKTGHKSNYLKIERFEWNRAIIWVYKDKASRDLNLFPFEFHEQDIPEEIITEELLKVEGNSLKTLAYAYLKTLPWYEGAIDV